jgi:hypothetical protein
MREAMIDTPARKSICHDSARELNVPCGRNKGIRADGDWAAKAQEWVDAREGRIGLMMRITKRKTRNHMDYLN